MADSPSGGGGGLWEHGHSVMPIREGVRGEARKVADRANTPTPKQTQQDRADDKRWDPVSLRADWTNGSLDFALPGSIFHQAGLGAGLPRTKGDPATVLHTRCPQCRHHCEPRAGKWGQGIPCVSKAVSPGAWPGH